MYHKIRAREMQLLKLIAIHLIHTDEDEEPSEEEISAIILKIMDKKGLVRGEIPAELAERLTKGFASFECPIKEKKWLSAHASCKIHLKELRISKRYTQDCKECNKPAKPKYSRERVEFVVNNAVRQCLRAMKWRDSGEESSGDDEESSNDDDESSDDVVDTSARRGPHDEKRCERCKELGHSCWKRY